MAEDADGTEIEQPDVTEDGEGGGPERPKSSKKRRILLALAGVLILGGAAAAYVLAPFGGGKDAEAAPHAAADAKPAIFYDLPDLTVNLATVDKRSQYLRLKVALEVSDQETIRQITPVLPRVIDTFQVFLRELRITDLEGSAGIYRLKEELRRRINLAVHPAEVDDVLFKELLIQ